MKFNYLYLLLLISSIAFSKEVKSQQGKLVGKIISSKTGDPLVGASVSVEGSVKRVVQSDLNGNYSISGLNPGSYSISCSFISYKNSKVAKVEVKSGEVNNFDIVLEPDEGTLSSVVIRAAPSNARARETVSSLLIAQKNSTSVSDGISAETIKRTPDRNTGDILKRVSGASLQEDKFAIVRGLNDRYNSAFLNGAPLPSSESDRKAFAFDIFPSNMLDNLIIYKTATPDMPAEFAGGQIVVNTKSIPSENFQTLSIGTGVNTIVTFKERKYYEGGKLDFLGVDKKRALPESFPDIASFKALDVNSRIKYAKTFHLNNWGLASKLATPNTSFQYVIGRNFQRNQKDFIGTIFSFTYNRTLTGNSGARTFYAPEYGNIAQRVYSEETFSTQTLIGAIANVSVKIDNNNNISLKNIFSINSDDRVLTRNGQDDIINERDRYTKSFALWFTGNRIFSSQLIGEHYHTASKIRLNWVASISQIQREIPGLRRMVYDSVSGTPSYIAKMADPNPVDNDNTGGLSFFSQTKENVQNFKTDFSRAFKFSNIFQFSLKAGIYLQSRNRSFDPRLLAFSSYNRNAFNDSLLSLTPDVMFNKQNMGALPKGKTGYALKDITEIRDLYTASTRLSAYYLMADQRVGKWLRLIYGARVENFNQKLYAQFNQFTPIKIDTTKLDVLPSLNLVFSLNNKQNIRAAYSRTLNRPEFRELAPFLFRDYSIRYSIFGDTALTRASIQNYDLRYEFYPGKAQVISVSGFYKKFTDPIELISATNQDKTLTYKNTPGASLLGLELEVRTLLSSLFNSSERSLLSKLTFFGNLTYLKSEVQLNVIDSNNYYFNRTRPMQGQSPYVVNGGIIYQDDKKNVSSTLSVNRYGQRIFLASNGDAQQDGFIIEPNLWENGRTQVDFQFTKALKNNTIELRLNVKDILAQKLFFYEDSNNNDKFDSSSDLIRSTSNFGRTISFQFTYKF